MLFALLKRFWISCKFIAGFPANLLQEISCNFDDKFVFSCNFLVKSTNRTLNKESSIKGDLRRAEHLCTWMLQLFLKACIKYPNQLCKVHGKKICESMKRKHLKYKSNQSNFYRSKQCVRVNEIWKWKSLYVPLLEAVVQRCSVKKAFLEFSQNSQENTCARVSFLEKRLWHMCFPVNFVTFLRTPFYRLLLVAASALR